MGDIEMLKGGLLAWLLWQGGDVVDVVDHRGSIGLGVLPERRGERNNKYQANIASQSITWQYDVPGVT